ncbi:acetamidase/formamidase family protein [Paenibacillus crassostreae]|uniref:Acetamidase n=1 Tax=Paenibacillus crassostreae TaxID=1763538 RepID=A0A167FFM7_9BACL|nr:acetamidase/formamidase family protein [Paenibacillus crassostreae]AOZ94454.1 acetamidase [Paenibacillus crassostreae]OAB76508.1 acetamidase [Paenibacillus crassostreae]
MIINRTIRRFGVSTGIIGMLTLALPSVGFSMPLQPTTIDKVEGDYYVTSAIENIRWGSLPNRDSSPILTVPSGSAVTFDTVSHEGLIEDQGRNPVEYFAKFGVSPDEVLDDAKVIASSAIKHDYVKDGPHIITGPVAVEGAEPGDVLKVEVLSLQTRVPYGVISNRHGKGALPNEFPENSGIQEGASATKPELYNNVSIFTPIEEINGNWYGVLPTEVGKNVRFPINPFLGVMGVAPNTSEVVSSIPPIETGGNMDINELGVGATIYYPIQVKGGLFYTGDPHFAQGDGEVALTALEASLRGTVRLTVLKNGDPSLPHSGKFTQPFAETEDYWIPIGLDPDLDEAMKESVRESIQFLSDKLDMDRAVAYAYLSAATDYEVSQVVDRTKGVHGLIRKTDFLEDVDVAMNIGGTLIKPVVHNNDFYVPIRTITELLDGTVVWDDKTRAMQINLDAKTISAQIGSDVYSINDKLVFNSNVPKVLNGQTVVPVSVINKILGAYVNWTTIDKTLTANVSLSKK